MTDLQVPEPEPVRRRPTPRRRISRTLRRHPALSVIGILVLVLAVLVGSWVVYLNHELDDVPRFDAHLDRPDRPARVPGDGVNILLVGVDDGSGADLHQMLQADTWQPGVFRSDTIVVLHISADRTQAQLVSIPRDSFVDVPGHGRTKINAAFSYDGPRLLAETVENLTGAYIDHVMVVDFAGFEGVTRTLGGVDVYIPETVTDTARDYTWTRGVHHLEGADALLYVRQRHGLPRGDFDRIDRQQNLIRAMLDKLVTRGTIGNPFKVASLAGQLGDFVSFDSTLTTGVIRSLGLSARKLRTQAVRFVTVPVTGTPTIAGQSVVTLDLAATQDLFTAVEDDDFDAWAVKNPTLLHELPDDQDVG